MILAVWFKKNLKQALLNQVYTDKAKVNGINVDDPAIEEKIYKQYLEAYKKGVFNYIKEEPADVSLRGDGADEAISKGITIARKYFSGGLTAVTKVDQASLSEAAAAFIHRPHANTDYAILGQTQGANGNPADAAMTAGVLPRVNPTETKSWRTLRTFAMDKERYGLRRLFSREPQRAQRLRVELNPQFEVDFSRNLIDEQILNSLIGLANEVGLRGAIEQMFRGDKINETENRAALHTALRNVKRDADGNLVAASPVLVDGKDVMPGVIAVLKKMEGFTKKIQSGEWRGASEEEITDVVNIGIGGSSLGPEMAAEALTPYKTGKVRVHFLSNVDGTAAAELMKKLDPKKTFVIIASKTFTTQETMQNAQTLKEWVLNAYKGTSYEGSPEIIKKHFVAVSTAKDLVIKFGIDPDNMFEFWDWVGGRYSVWSAIGLSLATYIGFDNFFQFLEGGHEADEHFRMQPFEHNIPVLKALLNVWYGNFLGARSEVILPYDQSLDLYPKFYHQLSMESKGKRVGRDGNPINYSTGLDIFGSAGTNGQHSFYEKLHQQPETTVVPADFIGVLRSHNDLPGHHPKLFSNYVAQTEALAFGLTREEVEKALSGDPKFAALGPEYIKWLAEHKTFPGNRPTTSILIDQVTPRTLGNLIALYEHQTYVESIIWNIFAFDQWGVELGKKVATEEVLPYLTGERSLNELPQSGLSGGAQKDVTKFIAANAANKAMTVAPELSVGRARLLMPELDYHPGKDLDLNLIHPKLKRNADEVIALLRAAKQRGVELRISGFLRGLDGAGSSMDLPEFQKFLTDLGAQGFNQLPSTTTAASDKRATIRFELADDPDVVEYVAPDYGITKDNSLRFTEDIKLVNGRLPNKQKDGVGYIFRNIFKLRGVRIVMDGISPIALAGGMESSNTFNVGLLAAGSMLSGANLSFADIVALAVKLENDEFGGLTGGQGHWATVLGRAQRLIWASGVKDSRGRLLNHYGVVAQEVLNDEQIAKIEQHTMLVQAGKEYKDGKALVGRTASLINNMWTDLLRYDSIGQGLHKEKLKLAARYAKAMSEGDFQTVFEILNRYVDIRNAITKRWTNLMIDAKQGKQGPEYAKEFVRKVFGPYTAKEQEAEMSHDYEVVRNLYLQHEKAGTLDQLRDISLYTLDPIATLIKEARKADIAIFPLGAGGPGSNMMAVSPKGLEHMQKFFQSQGVNEITDEIAARIVRGTGILKGYMPFKVGREGIKIEGFDQLADVEGQITKPELPPLRTVQASEINLASLAMMVTDPSILEWKSPHGLSLRETLIKIIKEYDIRFFDGYDDKNFPGQVDALLLRWIGRALGTAQFTSTKHGRSVGLQPGDIYIVGGDNGPSTDDLVKKNEIEGLLDTGVDVIDLGTTISGHTYKAIELLKRAVAQYRRINGGSYTTRSHVEVGTNGIKPVVEGITLYGDMLKAILETILTTSYREAEKRGELLTADPQEAQKIRALAKKLYFDSLRKDYKGLKDVVSKLGRKVAINLNSGSIATDPDYQELIKEIIGAENIETFLKAEPDPWATKGLADPTRADEKALAHPQANIVKYSEDHPQTIVFNFDLDVDRISILWGGKLYLGDEMFYPIIEYQYRDGMNPYAKLMRDEVELRYDSRMKYEIWQLARHFGAKTIIHPKGHSKVKATMDVKLAGIAAKRGMTVQQFLDAHPGFHMAQPEYSLHMFLSNELGQNLDDVLDFMFYWLNVWGAIVKNRGTNELTLANYIQKFKDDGVIDDAKQLQEQRMPINEDAKFKTMNLMRDQVISAFKGQDDFKYFDNYDDSVNRTKPYVLVDVEGVYHLYTPYGEAFWGWSNTSPKVAFGTQSATEEGRKRLAVIISAMYIHAREAIAGELGMKLAEIDPLETGALFALINVKNIQQRAGQDGLDPTKLGPDQRKIYAAAASSELESKLLADFPTMESALQAIKSDVAMNGSKIMKEAINVAQIDAAMKGIYDEEGYATPDAAMMGRTVTVEKFQALEKSGGIQKGAKIGIKLTKKIWIENYVEGAAVIPNAAFDRIENGKIYFSLESLKPGIGPSVLSLDLDPSVIQSITIPSDLGKRVRRFWVQNVLRHSDEHWIVSELLRAIGKHPNDQARITPGGIDLNSRNLKMQSEGQKVNITFDPAMIEQFRRGDFSGVKIKILNVTPINLMPLLGLKEE